MRQEDGHLNFRELLPTILVSAAPRYEESQAWYPVQVLHTLVQLFGEGNIRVCEACMRPRTQIKEGRLERSSGPISLDEIVRLDERFRGDSARAKSAIWIDETSSGVAVRITDLRSARIIFAQNLDPGLQEHQNSARSFRLSAELERRSRGESLTHALFDSALYPGQHFSLEWADQWGEYNSNLSGIVLSFYDPVLGIGAGHHWALGWQNILLGAQAILSIPTVIIQSQGDNDEELLDPPLTGVLVLRFPFGNSNYAGLLIASSNGELGLGISLLNTSFIPVLP